MCFNPSAGRTQYSGAPVAMTRAVQGVACGGMTLMSEATSKLVRPRGCSIWVFLEPWV
jgi:hypothetical protein